MGDTKADLKASIKAALEAEPIDCGSMPHESAKYRQRVAISEGWGDAGKTGVRLGPDVMVGQAWTPVLWDGEDEPDWHKAAGLTVGDLARRCDEAAPPVPGDVEAVLFDLLHQTCIDDEEEQRAVDQAMRRLRVVRSCPVCGEGEPAICDRCMNKSRDTAAGPPQAAPVDVREIRSLIEVTSAKVEQLRSLVGTLSRSAALPRPAPHGEVQRAIGRMEGKEMTVGEAMREPCPECGRRVHHWLIVGADFPEDCQGMCYRCALVKATTPPPAPGDVEGFWQRVEDSLVALDPPTRRNLAVVMPRLRAIPLPQPAPVDVEGLPSVHLQVAGRCERRGAEKVVAWLQKLAKTDLNRARIYQEIMSGIQRDLLPRPEDECHDRVHVDRGEGRPAEVTRPEGDASPRPKVVCFSGSSRFCAEMAVGMWEWEKRGWLALGLHLLPEWYTTNDSHQAEAEGVAAAMDELHLRKIDMADLLYVWNEGGYIGESTRREIKYATSLGKKIHYHESPEEASK